MFLWRNKKNILSDISSNLKLTYQGFCWSKLQARQIVQTAPSFISHTEFSLDKYTKR